MEAGTRHEGDRAQPTRPPRWQTAVCNPAPTPAGRGHPPACFRATCARRHGRRPTCPCPRCGEVGAGVGRKNMRGVVMEMETDTTHPLHGAGKPVSPFAASAFRHQNQSLFRRRIDHERDTTVCPALATGRSAGLAARGGDGLTPSGRGNGFRRAVAPSPSAAPAALGRRCPAENPTTLGGAWGFLRYLDNGPRLGPQSRSRRDQPALELPHPRRGWVGGGHALFANHRLPARISPPHRLKKGRRFWVGWLARVPGWWSLGVPICSAPLHNQTRTTHTPFHLFPSANQEPHLFHTA